MKTRNIVKIPILIFLFSYLIIFFNSALFLGYAQEPSSKNKYLTIENAVNIAIQNNPTIKAKRHKIEAAKGKIQQANLLPNLEISLLAEEMPTNEIGLNESQNMVSLSQKIEIGGKRKLRGDVAKQKKDILEIDMQTAIRDITAQTKKAFFDVIISKDKLSLAKKNVEIAISLKNIADKRFEAGDIAKLGVFKAQVALSNAKTNVIGAEMKMFNATKRLQTIMGTTDLNFQKLVPVKVTDIPALNLGKLEELLLKNYPALQAQKSIVDLSLLKVKETKRKRIPDIDLSIGYKRLSATDEDTIQAGITLPLPFFNRNQGNIIEANELLYKAKDDETAAKNELLFQLGNAFSMYKAARELVRSFVDTLIPQTEESLKIAKQGYEHGEFDYLDVLDAQRTLATTNVSYLKTLNKLFSSITEIERLVGVKISEIK